MRNLLALLITLGFVNSALASDKHFPVSSIYWSDGDSGRITKPDGTVIKFRLDDYDAPETGGIGAAVGPAQCELERERGFLAKEFMVNHTNSSVSYTHNNETDDIPDRKALLVRLYVDSDDLIKDAIEAGHLKRWLHDGSKALEARPTWCD